MMTRQSAGFFFLPNSITKTQNLTKTIFAKTVDFVASIIINILFIAIIFICFSIS